MEVVEEHGLPAGQRELRILSLGWMVFLGAAIWLATLPTHVTV